MNKNLMAVGGLLLALFLIMVIVGVVYVGSGYLKQTICEQQDDTYVWEGGACLNATGGTEVTVTALTKIDAVTSVIDIVLGLLALIVIVGLFAIVIKAAKGFAKGF